MKSIASVTLAFGFLFIPNWKTELKILIKNRLFQSVILIAILYILSVIVSENFSFYILSVKEKILYLFVPISMYCLLITDKQKLFGKFLFGACSLIQAIFAILFFIQHKTETEYLYSIGKVLPVIKIQHVQIAVLISFTTIMMISVLFSKTNKWIKISSFITSFCLIIFLHIFAVRTGIVLLYVMMILYLGLKLIEFKKWKMLAIVVILFPILIFTFYQNSTTLKSKISYMKYDILQFKNHDKNAFQYSDSRRLNSIKIGIEIANKYPFFGCGIGDIKDECAKIYKEENSSAESKFYYLPHSQYVYFISCFGYLFGFILIICFIYPVVYFAKQKNYLLTTLYSGLLIFGIWDAFLGTLFGNSIYLFLIGIGLSKNDHSITH